QAGDFNHCLCTKVQPGAGWQAEQVDALSGDVLAHLAGRDVKTGSAQFVMKLGVDQVDLSKIWCLRVDLDPRQMLDRRARMRIAFDPEAREQGDRVLVTFGERV